MDNKELLIKQLLSALGEDPTREGLLETPRRVIKMYDEILSGYKEDISKYSKTFTNEGGKNLVIVKDLDFSSLCEHHMVPFFGSISIGYIPDKKILGLSKFARISEIFAKRLQIQERLTEQILHSIVTILNPLGAAVKIEAKHLCMSMRGVQKKGAITTTTSYYGLLQTDPILHSEFLNQVNQPGVNSTISI